MHTSVAGDSRIVSRYFTNLERYCSPELSHAGPLMDALLSLYIKHPTERIFTSSSSIKDETLLDCAKAMPTSQLLAATQMIHPIHPRHFQIETLPGRPQSRCASSPFVASADRFLQLFSLPNCSSLLNPARMTFAKNEILRSSDVKPTRGILYLRHERRPRRWV
jgi:hypothetical protein